GALKVTDEISLAVEPGQTLGILGPNGAGKTTLFNLITGDLAVDRGRIEYDGRDVTRLPPHRRCRGGIGRSYQVPPPFVHMTVFETLVTAACFGGGQPEARAWQPAAGVLRETGLPRHANRLAGGLTLLDRKRLELARALATRPRLLLLDEVAGGLTEPECVSLVALIQEIRRSGVSIIWIEHVVHALLKIVDRLVVLHQGRFIAEGDPNAVIRSAAVREIYMGIPADA